MTGTRVCLTERAREENETEREEDGKLGKIEQIFSLSYSSFTVRHAKLTTKTKKRERKSIVYCVCRRKGGKTRLLAVGTFHLSFFVINSQWWLMLAAGKTLQSNFEFMTSYPLFFPFFQAGRLSNSQTSFMCLNTVLVVNPCSKRQRAQLIFSVVSTKIFVSKIFVLSSMKCY